MSKKNLTPEEKVALVLRLHTAADLTPEEVKELQALAVADANTVVSLTEENAKITEALEAKNAEISELKKAQTEFTKIVDGEFTAKNKKRYAFKEGFLKTRLKDPKLVEKYGDIIDSSLLLTEADLAPVMENLIKIKYGGIEEVQD